MNAPSPQPYSVIGLRRRVDSWLLAMWPWEPEFKAWLDRERINSDAMSTIEAARALGHLEPIFGQHELELSFEGHPSASMVPFQMALGLIRSLAEEIAAIYATPARPDGPRPA